MTSVSQVTQKISEQNAEEFGADGWEISAHVGARPSHAVYQGRQYPNSQYETIVLPLINDYNCRHSAYPIIMGVSKPAYTEEQLAAIDPPPFTYEGKQYTAYKAQQQMRKMERAMRKQKDRCIVADAAGDTDTFTAASIKLRRQKDIYEDFCKAAGTYTEYERTFVAGYNRRLAGKTGAVTRAQNKFKNAQIPLPNDVTKGKGYIEVQDEYKSKATPNRGKITRDEGYNEKIHKDEIAFADWLHSYYGGDIKLLKEVKAENIQTPDFIWNDKLWDLKTASTEKSANGLIRKGLHQIEENPGGIFLDYGDKDISIDVLLDVIEKRMKWYTDQNVDIMIVQKGEVVKVLRYEKKT